MKIRIGLIGFAAIILASSFSSIAFAKSIVTRQSTPGVKQELSPKLVNAAKRRDEKFVIVSTRGVVSGEFEIHAPEASFIKLHFSEFKLPAGVTVEVRNPEGSEVYRYSRTKKDAMTFNPHQGDDGIGSFSAMSISGDTVVVRVEGKRGQIQAFKHRVEIDHIMEGLPSYKIDDSQPVVNPTSFIESSGSDSKPVPQSSCGLDDREEVVCLQSTFPMEADRSRPVARLLINGNTFCTAWRVGSSNHLMTNRHCLPDQAKTSSTEVWFGYQFAECGSYVISSDQIKVTGNIMLINSYDLDYTLFSVSNFEAIEGFGYLGIETREGVIGDGIYIPQHGSGNPKEIGIESDMNVGGYCQIDAVDLNAYAAGTDVGYFCDTTGGSSGSPVVSADSNRVIALHHLGGCMNSGVSMSLIWPEISAFFDGVVPLGDDVDPSANQAPQSQFSVSCAGLHCDFDASSSTDVDGSIVSYDWNLGDGSTGSGITIGRDYLANGSYQVVLTVQDDEGALGQSSQTLSVTVANANPVAAFTVECTEGSCSFDAATSNDSDGTIATYSWSFGDGNSTETGNEQTTHDFAASGDYLVGLTVTDNLAATGTAESWITVTVAEVVEPLILTAAKQRGRGSKGIKLNWSGSNSSEIDVIRNGSHLATASNVGEYLDSSKLPKRTKSASYQVCEVGQGRCSNEFIVEL